MLFKTTEFRLVAGYLRAFPSCIFIVLFSATAQADFSLNFRPNTTNTGDASTDPKGYIGDANDQGNSCGITGYTDSGCFWFRGTAGTKNDITAQQPFRMEYVVADDGKKYWHLLLGNSTDDWKQDVWIRQTALYNYMTQDNVDGGKYQWTVSGQRAALSDSGGFASVYNDNKNQVTLGGNSSYGQMNSTDMLETEIYAGNGADPLRSDGQWTGNGTADPTRVIMRQIDNSGTAYQEFLKDSFDKKPLIVQKVNDVANGMSLEFQVDMRGMDYNTSRAMTIGSTTVTTPTDPAAPGNGNSTGYFGAPTNTDYAYNAGSEFVMKLNLTGASGIGADFDAAGERPVEGGALLNQNVNAGQYTYTPGNGWIASTAGDTYYSLYYQGQGFGSSNFTNMPIYEAGTYSYAGGSNFDPSNQPWKSLLDPVQSPCLANPYCP